MTADPGTDLGARFDTLYSRHFSALLAYSIRRVAHREDAADVVAEVFLVVWRRVDEVPDEPSTLPWLYGVAGNVLNNHVRGSRRRAALTGRLREALSRQPAAGNDPPDVVGNVPRGLSLLSATDREILQLSLWEELSPADIATTLGLRPGVVRNRLHRARTRLRTILVELEFLDSGEHRR
ncbi:sigma-70 family RNA polymerase sigma factor [Nakamurella silvestris]|nr:sigma-70 family RNA polymerase sigma factor [Nakamurella silvestris]